jgi:hypothetical protein
VLPNSALHLTVELAHARPPAGESYPVQEVDLALGIWSETGTELTGAGLITRLGRSQQR